MPQVIALSRSSPHYKVCSCRRTQMATCRPHNIKQRHNSLSTPGISSLTFIFSSSRGLTLARCTRYTAPSWSKNCDFSTPMYEIAARTCTYLNHTCSGALIQVKMTQNQDTPANATQAQQQAQGQQHRIAIPRPGALRSPC